MGKPRRDPIAKERFLEGNRQRWALLLICCAAGVLMANVYHTGLDPEPYLTFLTMIGCTFLLGMSLDSALKIRKRPDPDPTDYQPEPPEP